MIKKIFFPLLIFKICIILSACTTDPLLSALREIAGLRTAKVWIEKVYFKAASNVNNTSAVTVHLVIAYKAELLADLMKMDAETYFRNLEQLKRDYRDNIEVFEWDITVGQTREEKISPSRVSGEGAVFFARYESQGVHRVAINDSHEVIVQLDKVDFKVLPLIGSQSS